MPFEPFGYKFQVDLPLLPDNAKAAIRQRLKPWFEMQNGARGWILGPFICLWRSAFDRQGPMLIGNIRRNGFGTRISGRAGSDLNGIAWIVAFFALTFAVMLAAMFNGGQPVGILAVGAIFFLLLLVVLWMSHKDRREAEPLVRFLKETVSGPRPKRRLELDGLAITKMLTLNVDGDIREPPRSVESILDALESIEDDGFLILSLADEIYIQTASDNGKFVIERRDGGAGSHMEAVRRDNPKSKWLKRNFTFEETLEALLAYASDRPTPEVIEWRPMS